MDAALVGGALLSASLQVLLDRMASTEFLNFFRRQKLDSSLLHKLKFMLLTIRIVLNDADNKQFLNPAIEEWLNELQDAFYHADDLVDKIATYAAAEGTGSSSNQVLSCTNTFNDEIEDVIKRLDDFAKNKDVLGLKEVAAGQNLASNRLPTTCLVDDTDVYGSIRDDQEKITKLLVYDDDVSGVNQISVIPIVGMGGIGKTTLAQLVYNDGRVQENFDKKAWVCVSVSFDIFKIMKSILQQVTFPGFVNNLDDLNQLQLDLKQSLGGKKLLLVLDDVWNEHYGDWDVLQRVFKGAEQGSTKVIVTTRSDNVSSMMKTTTFHRVEKLSDEDCWLLFSKHAFENGDPSTHPSLQVIGKQIVNKCGGLPLAAKTLGGLLRSKTAVEEWDYICKSEIWDLPDDKSKILPVLRLSYHYLPSRFKCCFAYCSIFPKGYVFTKEELVLLWMAQKLLLPQPKGKKTMEEEGDFVFRELLARSFFQQSFGDESRFVMHDLINDLAQFVSGEFCFRPDDDKQTRDCFEKLRHFSYRRSMYCYCRHEASHKFKGINDAKYLRTFLPSTFQGYPRWILDRKVLCDMLPKQRCLRVLSLSGYAIAELPHSIGNLIHLRYLDVSYTDIKLLPESITTLYNLETLLLSNCSNLTMLPRDMRKLVCLRHFDLSGTIVKEMPFGMELLKSLQFLSSFVVGKDSGSRINALGGLSNLQKKLSLSGLENVINGRDALEADLKGKKLEDLVFEWSTCSDNMQYEKDVLENLQPHTKVKILKIKNYGGEIFPSWLGKHSYNNLVSLRFEGCEGCVLLPQLGQLRSLKSLMIKGMKQITVVGPEFFGDDSYIKPFQSLETLKFEGMIEWEEWQPGEFPSLKELSFNNCPKLTGKLPSQLVFSLRRLEIIDCHQLILLSNGQDSIFCNQVGLLQQSLSSLTIFCNQVGLLQQSLSSLKSLVISSILKLEELPPELSILTNLQSLVIKDCGSLESFPNMGFPSTLRYLEIIGCDALQLLPDGMPHINTCLRELLIAGCQSLLSFPSGGLPVDLKVLDISHCSKLELPDEMEQSYKSIEVLNLHSSCDSIKSFPWGLFPKLISLSISGCINLETLSIRNGLELRLHLQRVTVRSCPKLVYLLDGRFLDADLQYFLVSNCENLKSLPSFFRSLPSLTIEYCPELEGLSEGCLPSNLQTLKIRNCHKLMVCRKDWGLQRLPSLKEFVISGEDEEEDVWKTFPEEWLLPSSLSLLVIWDSQNLKSLNHMGLRHLTSLKTLCLCTCPQLVSLPEEVLPSSINELMVEQCPLLKLRCQKEKGEDWPKIAHIPFIKVDQDVL